MKIGGGDGQNGLRGRPLRSVRKNILNWSCRNPNKTKRFESVRAGSGQASMLCAVKARKPRPRKAPKATSTRGRRKRQSGQPALTFRLYRRPADGPTVPGPDRGPVRTGRRVTPSRMLTTRFLFPKFFPKKIWPKNWAGSSNRKFREWFMYGSGWCRWRALRLYRERYRRGFVPGGILNVFVAGVLFLSPSFLTRLLFCG